MKIIKSFVRVIGKIISFIWNAIWVVLGLLILGFYGYSSWLNYQEEQEEEARNEFIEAEAEEYRNTDLGDESVLVTTYQAACDQEITNIKDISEGNESSLCQATATVLLNTSKKTGMTLDNFAELTKKLCMRDDGSDPEYCDSEALSAKRNAIKNGIGLALCDVTSAWVIKDNDTKGDYISWQLTKRGTNVYDYGSTFVDCGLRKFHDIGYQGFFDEQMTEEELYPEFDIVGRLWEQFDNKNDEKVIAILDSHTFGQNPEMDKQIMGSFLYKDHLHLLPALLERNGNQINFDIEYYDQPLHEVIGEGDEQAVLNLIAAGADPLRPDSEGATPITKASGAGMVKAVDALLKKGADVHGLNGAENFEYAAPLHQAAMGGHKAVVAHLLKNGAKLKPADPSLYPEWETEYLLSAALYGGDVNIVNAFVLRGAEFGPDRDTIRQAIQGGSPEVVNYVFSKGIAMPEQELHDRLYDEVRDIIKGERQGALEDGIKIFDMLVAQGLNMAHLSSNGSSYAHQAIVHYAPNNIMAANTEQGKQKSALQLKFTGRVIDEVLKSGVDINQTGNKNYTMLMHAADRSHPSLVKQLLDNGADASLTNEKGETALDIAVREGRRLTRFWKKKKELKSKFSEVITLLGGDPAILDQEIPKQ